MQVRLSTSRVLSRLPLSLLFMHKNMCNCARLKRLIEATTTTTTVAAVTTVIATLGGPTLIEQTETLTKHEVTQSKQRLAPN